MSNSFIDIRVQYPPWAESEKSWCFLTSSNVDETSWSVSCWFPKKVCKLSKTEKESVRILTMPIWLYNQKIKKF